MKPDSRFLKAAEIRAETAEDGSLIFGGYAAVFDSLSEDLGGFREVIKPGAFDRSLNGADVRCLQNHDASKPLGRTSAGNLRLWADSRGLAFECRALPTSYARDLKINVDGMVVTGCSFRFYVAEGGDEWTRTADGGYLRTLRDVEIDEVTIATFPAYLATSVSTRSIEQRDAFETRCRATKPPAESGAQAHKRRLARIAAALR